MYYFADISNNIQIKSKCLQDINTYCIHDWWTRFIKSAVLVWIGQVTFPFNWPQATRPSLLLSPVIYSPTNNTKLLITSLLISLDNSIKPLKFFSLTFCNIQALDLPRTIKAFNNQSSYCKNDRTKILAFFTRPQCQDRYVHPAVTRQNTHALSALKGFSYPGSALHSRRAVISTADQQPQRRPQSLE